MVRTQRWQPVRLALRPLGGTKGYTPGGCNVTKSGETTGTFRSGLPYNRIGHGRQILVVFQGLAFENKPLTGVAASYLLSMYGFLKQAYTTYVVTRKPGLPDGYSMQDMADDYAVMITEEFGGPVDVIGTSTGGSIAQHFAADHPDLVRRLVLYASAYTLGDEAKEVQMRVGRLARQRKWREASSALLGFTLPPSPFGAITAAIASLMMSLTAPDDPSDLIVTVEAEDRHNFKDRLAEIRAPTLVITGARDPFYTEALLRETAEGIPNARLILYEGKGHAPAGKQFGQDVLTFLKSE
jgi:pimeloyl-ACP methyl ester carboxylesterase